MAKTNEFLLKKNFLGVWPFLQIKAKGYGRIKNAPKVRNISGKTAHGKKTTSIFRALRVKIWFRAKRESF